MRDLATVDHLLTTTRSVRKRLDLDRPVEPDLIARCLEIAMQAPSGTNGQRWHFVVITDAPIRWEIAGLYRRSYTAYAGSFQSDAATTSPVRRSADYLAAHFHRVPVLILPPATRARWNRPGSLRRHRSTAPSCPPPGR